MPKMFKSNVNLLACADGSYRADAGCFPTPVAKTAAYTLLKSDAGKVFSNAGASGSVTITLPTVAKGAVAGMRFHFTVAAAQTLVVAAPAATKINGSADAGNMTAAGTQNGLGFLSVMFNGTSWVPTSVTGTWTTN